MRTSTAFDASEKAEIENMFLDCIEHCKRAQLKEDMISRPLRDTMSLQPPQNLTRAGFELRQKLVNDKDTLIAIFEDLFSPHMIQKAQMYPSNASFA